MKTKIMAASTLALALFGGMNLAHADDGSFKFIGSLTEDACTISGGADQSIDMGTVPTGGGSAVSQRDMAIALTNCPSSVTQASFSIMADPSSVSDDRPDAIKDTLSDGSESAAGYWVVQADGDNLNNSGFGHNGWDTLPVDGSLSADYSLTEGDNTLGYIVFFQVAPKGRLEPGTHTGTATYTITYE